MLYPELIDQTQLCTNSHVRVCLVIIKIIFTNCLWSLYRLNVDHLIYFDSMIKIGVSVVHRAETSVRCQCGFSYLRNRDHIWRIFDIQLDSKDFSAFRLFLFSMFRNFRDRQSKWRDLDLMLACKWRLSHSSTLLFLIVVGCGPMTEFAERYLTIFGSSTRSR